MTVNPIGSTTTAYAVSTTSVSSTTPTGSTTATSSTTASTTVSSTTSSTTVNYSSATASTTCSTTILYGGASTTASVSSTTIVSSTTLSSSVTASVTPTISDSPIRDTEYKDYFVYGGTYVSEYEKMYYSNPVMHDKLEELYYKDVNFTGSINLGKVTFGYTTLAERVQFSYGASAEITIGNEEALRSISTDICKAIKSIAQCIEEYDFNELDGSDLSLGSNFPGVSAEVDTNGGGIVLKMPDGMTEVSIKGNGVNNIEVSIVQDVENESYGSLQVEMTLAYGINIDDETQKEEVYAYAEAFAKEWESQRDEMAVLGTVAVVAAALFVVGTTVLTGGTGTAPSAKIAGVFLAWLWSNNARQQGNGNSNELIY